MRSRPLLFVLLLAGAAPGLAHASPEAGAARATPSGAELDEADLDRLLAPLASSSLETRRSALSALEALDERAVDAIGRKLDALRKTPEVGAVAKSARAAAGRGELDLLEALVTRTDGSAAHVAAVTTAALARALAKIGTTPAIRELVKVAVGHDNAFREEVARHVAALGERSVPALLETRTARPELRYWAYAQLESMGKRIPSDAVQTPDDRVLADVLRAFAHIRDVDAIPVILAFVNSDRRLVRQASRDALRSFGEDATAKLREAYANVTGKPAPGKWQASELAKELFSAYDRLRLQEVHAMIDEGLAKYGAGAVEEAVVAFDKVLARTPLIDRRVEMVPAYIAHARAQKGNADRPAAIATLRKTTRLWPDGPRVTQIEAEIAYLEAKELLDRGVVDAEGFERALALDPTHEEARAELRRLDEQVDQRTADLRLAAAASAAGLVAVVGGVLFGGRRRRRARS